MATMQVFDLICGQVDRNMRNYYVTTEGNTITGIQMIDNDMSFGKLTAVGKDGKNVMKLSPANKELIDALSDEIKDAVKRLNTYSTGDLKFIFGDILSDDEIGAMKERIKTINDFIIEREEYYDKLSKGEIVEEEMDEVVDEKMEEAVDKKKIAECMKDPEFRAIYYQRALHKKINKKVKEIEDALKKKNKVLDQDDKRRIRVNYVMQISYLNYYHMMSYKDAEKAFWDYMKK
jgi:hypothetical protein